MAEYMITDGVLKYSGQKNLYGVICYERLTSCNFLSSNLLGSMGRTKSYAYYT